MRELFAELAWLESQGLRRRRRFRGRRRGVDRDADPALSQLHLHDGQPAGAARLRISLSAAHAEEDVGRLVDALIRAEQASP